MSANDFTDLTDREQSAIVRKIKGLLNLASSPNVHEAAAAAAKAQEMLLKYKLEMADVSVAEQKEAKAADPLITDRRDMGKKAASWKLSLADAVAHGFFCRCVYTPGRKWAVRGATITFVGRKTDVEVAHYTFEYLGREIDRLADIAVEYERDIKGRIMANGGWKVWRNDFRMGAVSTLRQRLRESEQKIVQQSGNVDRSRALVLASKQEVETYFHQQFPRLHAGGGSSRGLAHGDAYSAGQRAGRSISLTRGVGGGAGPRQIGG